MTIFYKNKHNTSKDLSLNVEFTSTSCHVRFVNDDVSKMSQKQSYSVGISYDRFYYHRVSHMVEKLNKRTLSGPDEIRATIEYVSWYLYRVEIIWNEFSQLQSRHKVRIEINAPKGVLLHVQLGSKTKEKNVSAIFGVGFAYPFCMLDFELKGNVNITTLERHLRQKSKPGFGYISKTCDLISAFLDNHNDP